MPANESRFRREEHDSDLRAAGTVVPVGLSGGRPLKLQVFLDRSVMEVFVDDGRYAVTRVVYPGEKDLAVAAFAEGGDAEVARVDVWQMKGIWPDGERTSASSVEPWP